MSYFKCSTTHCVHYPSEWEAAVEQIKDWPTGFGYDDYQWPLPRDVCSPLEAKALYVFTMARHLVRAAYGLAERAGRWHLIFVETSSILFPMIELVGHARLDDRQVKKAYGRSEVNVANLWAGIHWLRDPAILPQVKNNRLKYDPSRLDVLLKYMELRRKRGPEARELVFTRHYFLHGSKAWDGERICMPDVMNYELPRAIARRAEEVMPIYWKQLEQDDGSQGWVQRLACADIRPFIIQGSGTYEKGLIDPDVVDYLEGHRDIWGHGRRGEEKRAID